MKADGADRSEHTCNLQESRSEGSLGVIRARGNPRNPVVSGRHKARSGRAGNRFHILEPVVDVLQFSWRNDLLRNLIGKFC